MNGLPVLDLDCCRQRQRRLRERMTAHALDAVIVTRPEHVAYLTGHRWDSRFTALAAMAADGDLLLVCPDRTPADAAATVVRTFEAKWQSTLRMEQAAAAAAVLGDWLRGSRLRHLGIEFSACPVHVTRQLEQVTLFDIEPDLFSMRRRKDADELVNLRRAIEAAAAMATTARDVVRPGISELEVFSRLQTAAVAVCGEMLTGTGNDYACGQRGGPPRDRPCEAGELFILDLGPAYRGYFADICRTFAVDGNPTDEQAAAADHVRAALRLVERTARGGTRCRDLYETVRQWLAEAPLGSWSSHLGHGIGLFVHEAPHLNPHWDDVLEAGEVIAVEPALYAPGLRAGIRLENDYLVTETGLELLSPVPLEL